MSRNRDGWMCGELTVKQVFARSCGGADVAIIEGVMEIHRDFEIVSVDFLCLYFKMI